MALPELYQEQEYQRQTFDDYARNYFQTLHPNASKRDTRRFNRYMNSKKGAEAEATFNKAQDEAEAAFVQSEIDKRAASWDARLAALREQNTARGEAALKAINTSLAAKPTIPTTPALVLKDAARWNQVASQYGFKDYNAVAAWQKENGLTVDGKFGSNSYAKWAELNPDKVGTVPVIKPRTATPTQTPTPKQEQKRDVATPTVDSTSPEFVGPVPKSATPTPTPTSNVFKWDKFKDAFGLETFTYDGKTYARYDPDGIGDFAIGQDGKIYHYSRNNMLGRNQVTNDLITYTLDQPHTGTFKENLQMLNGLMAPYRKQGGTMNRINYFQQGGAAPQQQDVKAQVTALVQAAMQGDQKATETVNKIMEAAKAGDQQALQLAQMIQEVAKQMQGQATAAKWGAKLNYLQSLKCGGRAKKSKKN